MATARPFEVRTARDGKPTDECSALPRSGLNACLGCPMYGIPRSQGFPSLSGALALLAGLSRAFDKAGSLEAEGALSCLEEAQADAGLLHLEEAGARELLAAPADEVVPLGSARLELAHKRAPADAARYLREPQTRAEESRPSAALAERERER